MTLTLYKVRGSSVCSPNYIPGTTVRDRTEILCEYYLPQMFFVRTGQNRSFVTQKEITECKISVRLFLLLDKNLTILTNINKTHLGKLYSYKIKIKSDWWFSRKAANG